MVVVAPERPQTIEIEPEWTEPVEEPKTSEIGDDLRQAAIEIVQRGWCQGDLQIEGRVCMLGALQFGVGGAPGVRCQHWPEGSEERYLKAERYLARNIYTRDAATYNDVRRRTREQVLNKLKELADRADREGAR